VHMIAVDSKGNLYAAEVAPGNRAQRFLQRVVGTRRRVGTDATRSGRGRRIGSPLAVVGGTDDRGWWSADSARTPTRRPP
jgi:hypothetical protein